MNIKKRQIKYFIFKIGIKIFIFAMVLGIMTYLINFPTFTNSMAMAQFENDNFSYMLWDSFLRFKNFFNSYYDLIISIFAGTVIYDIYNFIKINKGENKHEN